MHDVGFLVPIMVVGIIFASKSFRTWVHVRHGVPLPSDRRSRRRDGGDTLEAERKVMLLSNENERLTGQVGRLEERIAVLERIATDPAERTAREIDALRSR